MEEITFWVEGSAPDPYEVRFVKRTGTNLSAYCTCPAGQNGQYCKHRFRIFEGVTDGIVSDNVDDVKVVQSWLPGSDIEHAMMQINELEKKAAAIKRELTFMKKELARAMRD